jgi:hypothetical protein
MVTRGIEVVEARVDEQSASGYRVKQKQEPGLTAADLLKGDLNNALVEGRLLGRGGGGGGWFAFGLRFDLGRGFSYQARPKSRSSTLVEASLKQRLPPSSPSPYR